MIGTGDETDRLGIQHLVIERQLKRPATDATDDDIHRTREQIVQQRGHHFLFNIKMQVGNSLSNPSIA